MKFLAMLKDSLREAVDSKVFFVMVGLSALVILLAVTVTFTPMPGGEMVMRAAAVPLSVDLASLETAAEDDDPTKLIERLKNNTQDVYQVTEVQPLNGMPDAVTSTFLVKMKVFPLKMKGLFGGSTSGMDMAARIREKFGQIGDWTIADVLEVKQVEGKSVGFAQAILGQGTEFEVTVRPAQMANRLWPHSFSLFFGALPVFGQEKGVPLGAQVYLLEQVLVNTVGAWITILVSVVITAFFIPNMLRKGTVDLLIVKPISRPVLLLYKYVGGLIFIAVNTAVAVGGVWLALGSRSGIWSPGFLASIPVMTFFFAILYSASTLFAVLTRSPIVAILLTCAVWFLFFIVGFVHGIFESFRDLDRLTVPTRASFYTALVTLPANEHGGGPLLAAAACPPQIIETLVGLRVYDWTFAKIVAGLHYILPRTGDLSALNSQLSFRELVFPIGANMGRKTASISWGESLTVSGIFIALMLSLSCWRFAAKDY